MSAPVQVFSFAQMHADVDVEQSLRRVVQRGSFVLGPEVEAFERAFAAYCGVDHCIGVASGTDALELALRALGIEPGQRVAIVANAGGYSAAAVCAVGAVPVWVDVDDRSLTMAPSGLEAALASGPHAVIATHLYGQLADITRLEEITRTAGIPLIEDCAQAHGAKLDGGMAGSFGTIGCFSFYPTKNLGAVGDGGAVVAHDAAIAARIRSLRQYGWSAKYHAELSGGRNSRLDEIQAAVVVDKLPHLDDWNRQRREIAGRYADGLSDLPITLPTSAGEDYVAHLYVVRVADRVSLARHLADAAVSTAVHYPVADHRQAAYHSSDATHLPVTDEACSSVLTLPCYPGLEPERQDHVIGTIRTYFAAGGR